MTNRILRMVSFMPVLLLIAALMCAPILASSGQAASAGTLKLMVWGCKGSGWLSNAAVGVGIVRPGAGLVDSDSGYTNSSGYVEFTFDDLENGDQAHVTVTASGSGPDSDHIYYWIVPQGRSAGYWDLDGMEDSGCTDDWYDQEAGIIKCAYDLPDSQEDSR